MVFFLIPFLAHAQRGQIQFSRIDVTSGLSHNEINAILKDSRGLMWFGSLSGLNRFDGYQFKVFKHDSKDTTSIIDNFITEIFELPDHHLYIQTRSGPTIYDAEMETFSRDVKGYLNMLHINSGAIRNILTDEDGNFWFNALEQGIFKYDIRHHTTAHFHCDGRKSGSLAKAPVSFVQKDSRGGIWVIHDDKTVELLNRKTGRVVKCITALRQQRSAEYEEIRMFVDKDADLWIYRMSSRGALTFYATATGGIRFIDKGPQALNSDLINGIVQDEEGLIWIGTDNGGLNLLDKRTFSIRNLSNKNDEDRNSAPNSIISLYKDPSGIIWAGTFKKGVSFYHEKIIKFPLFRRQLTNPNGLTYDDINRFAEDKKGNIWVGTNGGGLFYFDRKTSRFTGYKHQASNSNSLSNDIIVSLFVDKQDKLWIGTYYGGLDYFDGQQFKHYRANSKDPGSLADDRVWDIMEDSKGRLWVATLSGGLDMLDRSTQTFVHHKAGGGNNSLGSNFISSLTEARNGSIWIGTSDGVDEMKSNGHFVHYKNIPGKVNSLINNVVYSVMQDSYGFIWITTRDGLSRLDPATRQFRNFDAKDGLTEKATLKIVEDNNKNLWLSTANGLFAIIVKKNKHDFSYAFRRYDTHDGLQENAFNANAGFRTKEGELIFGGTNGFNIFQPQNIRDDNSTPEIIISDLQIANKSVGVGERVEGRVLLHKSIVFTKNLELKYNQNALTLEFAALNFFNPHKIKYRYKLEGFDQRWQELQGDIRRATYTNIDPGVYTFKVVSTNASGNWVNNPVSLVITILPPLWRTSAAYLCYILLIAGTLLLIRHRGIQKIRKKLVLEQERIQAKRVHELDMLKIKFLTNVSHEFRTPLSLIITPLEKLIRQAGEAEKPQLQMIHRNGRRLLNLVNQLLDFRRMEVQELKLHPKTGDIILFIQESALAFTDVAERKNIFFSVHTDRASLVTSFDYDKIERILFNLLSNAFKFTLPGGTITVSISCSENDEKQTMLMLRVSDTGIGIEQDKKEKVFDTFFQSDVPNSIVNQGSGIGLSITKEFVSLHGGTISVDSVLGEGTTFTVILRFLDEQQENTAAGNKFDLIISKASTINPDRPVDEAFTWKSKKPIVMLVEDNEDFRFYLKDNLKEFYQIVEAVNGKEGWQRILSAHPDLVVSDVSMPEMDGIELCKKIKSDQRTAHLPVILLTALSNENQQLTGLETGANDYMTKPFNFEILLSKIKNLLQQQAQAKKTFQKQIQFTPTPTEIESVDDKFIRQLSAHIEKHLSDPGYTVDQLSTDMNMSRVGLYKKILPLTGKSPIEYIRSYRLQKAKPLLLKSQMTIAEVAYAVGFSNPKHFSKYFKQEFEVLPSVYALTKGDTRPEKPD